MSNQIHRKTAVLWVFLALSFVLSSCGTSADKGSQSSAQDVKKVVEPKVSAVFTKSRIARNKIIKLTQLEVRMVPVSELPENEEYAVSLNEMTEAVALRDIHPNTLIVRSLWTYDTVKRLSQLVSPGKTAITVGTDVSSAMAFIAPNDIVDVIATYSVSNAAAKSSYDESRVIAVNCKVLAVDREFLVPRSGNDKQTSSDGTGEKIRNPFTGRDKIRSVTIEVDPYVAQKIALVSSDPKTNKVRLAAHSESAGINDAVGIGISSNYLGQMADEEKDKLIEQSGNKISDRVVKFSGTGRSRVKVWSEKELNATYDADADAPLSQDRY